MTLSQSEAQNRMRDLRAARPLSTQPLPDSDLVQLLEQIAEILEPFDFEQALSSVRRAGTDTTDADALYRAGYELVDIGLNEVAVPILASALHINPMNGRLLTELAAALNACWAYGLAADLLRDNQWALEQIGPGRYLLAHDAAMCGDLETTRDLLPTLSRTHGEPELMARTARARVARYDAITPSIADPQLPDWELVLNGIVLLTCGDVGEDAMHGRWAFAQETPDQIAHRLSVLQGVLTALKRQPTRVAFAPDRDSEILAHAVASTLGIDTVVDGSASRADDDLIVAYMWPGGDPAFMGAVADDHRAILYAHHLNWTQGASSAPDIAAAETQFVIPPWGEQIVIPNASDPTAKREATRTPADTRDPAVIAQELMAVPVDVDAVDVEVDRCSRLVTALRDAGATCGALPGPRGRFYPGGPVVSNRFQ
ncbi:MAG: hypothetical protein FWD75_09755 [Propionibacteriaceae bacterium]|nr:hypothetical protein [Propionibacteriaceae bacterium]